MENRLQFLHVEELYANKEEIIKALYESDFNSLYGEPIVFKYGNADSPNIVIAIGSNGGGGCQDKRSWAFIDSDAIGSEFISEIKIIKELISEINGKIDGIDEELSDIDIEISGLTDEVAVIKDEISGITEDVEGLSQTIEDHSKVTSAALNELNSKIGESNNEIQSLKDADKTHNEQISGLTEQISDVENTVSGLTDAVDVLEQTVEDHSKVTSAALNELNKKIEDHSKVVASALNELDTKVEGNSKVTSAALNELNKKFGDNVRLINVNKESIENLKVIVEGLSGLTKEYIDEKLSNVWEFKGIKNTYEELEAIAEPRNGDVYIVGEEEYAYDGTKWVLLGYTSVSGDYVTHTEFGELVQEIIDNEETTSASLNDLNKRVLENKKKIEIIQRNPGGVTDVKVDGKSVVENGVAELNNIGSIYKPNLDGDVKTDGVGGIKNGTTVSQLSGKTFTEILNKLLFPETYPKIATKPSFGFEPYTLGGPYEVGTEITIPQIGKKTTAGKFNCTPVVVPEYTSSITENVMAITEGFTDNTIDIGDNTVKWSYEYHVESPSNQPVTSHGKPTTTTENGSTAIWGNFSGVCESSYTAKGVLPIFANISGNTIVENMVKQRLFVGNEIELNVPTEVGTGIFLKIQFPYDRDATLQIYDKFTQSYVNYESLYTVSDSVTLIDINDTEYKYKVLERGGNPQGEGKLKIIFSKPMSEYTEE